MNMEKEENIISQKLYAGEPISLEEQRTLARSKNIPLVRELACHPSLLPEVQKELAIHENIVVIRFLAKNPSLIPELQEELINHKDMFVNRSLANNPGVLPEIKKKAIKRIYTWNGSEIINKGV